MKKCKWLLMLALLPLSNARAQTLHQPITAGYTGLGAYSILHVDVFSFATNPSSLAQLKHPSAGVYAERRFLMDQLNNYSAMMALPLGAGAIGISSGYFGFTEYNETRLGIGYGLSLGSKLDIGCLFNYHAIRIAGYGSASAIGFALGVDMHISERLHFGMEVENPLAGRFNKGEQEKLSSLYSLGFGYDASPKVFISAVIEKEENQPLNVNAGIQYKFLSKVLARGGISTATSSGWIGIGLMTGLIRFDVTSSFHPQLGITPGLLFIIQFNAAKSSKMDTE